MNENALLVWAQGLPIEAVERSNNRLDDFLRPHHINRDIRDLRKAQATCARLGRVKNPAAKTVERLARAQSSAEWSRKMLEMRGVDPDRADLDSLDTGEPEPSALESLTVIMAGLAA